MTAASIGYDALIESSTTEAGTYTALVTEPTLITIPSIEVSRVDATHLQSPGRTKEYIPGMFDPAAASYEANYVKADYLALKALEGVARWFKVSSPDTSALTATFPGYIHKIELEFTAEDVSKVKWEIQTTGEVTVA